MHKLRFCLNPFVVVVVVVCAMTLRYLISSKSDLFIEVKTEEGRENRVSETTGVNFTNVLCAAFTLVGPKSAK